MSLSLSPTLSTRDLFLDACDEGDLELARVLLARGAGVNWRQEEEDLSSGLHLAALGDHGDLVDLLLAQPGVDVNIKDAANYTPLMEACIKGRENIIGKLLQVEGIELNCQSRRGKTALHLATEFDFPNCVQLLREAPGLEWNLRDVDGDTPLLTAAGCGSPGSLEIILSVPQPQLDLTVTDDEGYNVAWAAVLGDEEEGEAADQQRCVELLSADLRVDWNYGDTPLLYCLEEGKVEIARIIIKNPTVDLNVQNNAGKFPETIAR